MTALLEVDHRLVAEGQVILADKGFAGREFETFLTDLHVHLVRPARRNTTDRQPTPVESKLLKMRQWIEAIFDTLKGQVSSNNTAPAATPGSTPASDCWPCPPRSGTTPSSEHPANAPSSPTTTEHFGII
jgi:hypothetical protein